MNPTATSTNPLLILMLFSSRRGGRKMSGMEKRGNNAEALSPPFPYSFFHGTGERKEKGKEKDFH